MQAAAYQRRARELNIFEPRVIERDAGKGDPIAQQIAERFHSTAAPAFALR